MLLLPALTTLSIAIGSASAAATMDVPVAAYQTGGLPYLAQVQSAGDRAMAPPSLAALPASAIAYLDEVREDAGSAPFPGEEALAMLPMEEADSPMGPAAGTDQLDEMRGGDGTTSSIVMNGTVTDNRANNVVTGANTITAGAFANASGVPMVVQNTGANVLIQNATVINLRLQ